MPQNAFVLRAHDLLVSQTTTQRHLSSTLHPLSKVIFATATVLALVLLRDSSFSFHCYAQREATPTQKSARKCAATSRDFLRERLQSAFTLANQLRWIAQWLQSCKKTLLSRIWRSCLWHQRNVTRLWFDTYWSMEEKETGAQRQTAFSLTATFIGWSYCHKEVNICTRCFPLARARGPITSIQRRLRTRRPVMGGRRKRGQGWGGIHARRCTSCRPSLPSGIHSRIGVVLMASVPSKGTPSRKNWAGGLAMTSASVTRLWGLETLSIEQSRDL